jgi:type IV secretion system protein VirB11
VAFETEEQMNRLDMKLRSELGPEIVDALANPDVLEICVNDNGSLWLESKGDRKVKPANVFVPAANLIAALGTIAASKGMELNETCPFLAAELPLDIAVRPRVQGIIPPASPRGPVMTIRKHAPMVFGLDDYVRDGQIDEAAAAYLRKAIADRKNIVVSGGTSSGKTTFANALLREIVGISPDDRVILIEETQELQCEADDQVRLVSVRHGGV